VISVFGVVTAGSEEIISVDFELDSETGVFKV